MYKKVKIFGLMNTGTTILKKTLEKYYQIDVFVFNPWKHSWEILTDQKDDILYIVIVKDPLFWILSMQKEIYNGLFWDKNIKHPVIYNNVDNFNNEIYNNYRKIYHKEEKSLVFDNIILTWNYFMNTYNKLDKKIIVKYEELLFNLQNVITQLDLNLDRKDKNLEITLDEEAAKTDTKCRNKKEAIQFYSDSNNRVNHFTKEELEYINQHLDIDLMKQFNYDLLN